MSTNLQMKVWLNCHYLFWWMQHYHLDPLIHCRLHLLQKYHGLQILKLKYDIYTFIPQNISRRKCLQFFDAQRLVEM